MKRFPFSQWNAVDFTVFLYDSLPANQKFVMKRSRAIKSDKRAVSVWSRVNDVSIKKIGHSAFIYIFKIHDLI